MSTYPFGVFLGTKLLHSAFENQRGKKKRRGKKKKKNAVPSKLRLFICITYVIPKSIENYTPPEQ